MALSVFSVKARRGFGQQLNDLQLLQSWLASALPAATISLEGPRDRPGNAWWLDVCQEGLGVTVRWDPADNALAISHPLRDRGPREVGDVFAFIVDDLSKA